MSRPLRRESREALRRASGRSHVRRVPRRACGVGTIRRREGIEIRWSAATGLDAEWKMDRESRVERCDTAGVGLAGAARLAVRLCRAVGRSTLTAVARRAVCPLRIPERPVSQIGRRWASRFVRAGEVGIRRRGFGNSAARGSAGDFLVACARVAAPDDGIANAAGVGAAATGDRG